MKHEPAGVVHVYAAHRCPTSRDFLDAVNDYVHSHDIVLSQIEIGRFLAENFADEILEIRRARERLIGSGVPRCPRGSWHGTDPRAACQTKRGRASAPEAAPACRPATGLFVRHRHEVDDAAARG